MVNLEYLKEHGILCDNNQLDPMFKIALKSTTTVLALTTDHGTEDMATKLKAAVGNILIQLMKETDDIEAYVEAVYVLVLREGKDHSGLSQSVGRRDQHSPYG